MSRAAGAPPASGDTTEFLGLVFDAVSLEDVLAWIAARGPDATFAYVVTPNVDHMVRLQRLTGDARAAYERADLRLCDSRILQRIAAALGIALSLVPGSDLTAALFARGLNAGDRILLIGGTPAHVETLRALHPALDIVQHVPPMGLLRDAAARAAIVDVAAAARAKVILLAVGAPQQELIALEMRRSGRVGGTALCIGASVDFLVGTEKRAPELVQRLSLEWAWRLAGNPRRLARRYLIEGPAIFPIAWRWAHARRKR